MIGFLVAGHILYGVYLTNCISLVFSN